MKRLTKFASLALAATLCIGAVACGNDQKAGDKKTATKTKTESKAGNLPNYRYVDLDTILSQYNLAKDYNEEILRMQTNAESQMKQHQTKIQNFASTVQNKMQNNGYLSEASYKQDEQTYANMQTQAQRSMESLQSNLMTAQANAQKAVSDSIDAFIKDYNKTRGYDAILYKGATLYINPDLDITSEVVEGLNARYNKVKK